MDLLQIVICLLSGNISIKHLLPAVSGWTSTASAMSMAENPDKYRIYMYIIRPVLKRHFPKENNASDLFPS